MKEGNELKIEQNTYLIREILGQGSFGKVYKGQNKLTQQIVAIKIQDNISEYELMMLNNMKGKKFKNLINILNLEQINRKYFIVMEYCKESLFERIQRKGTIKAEDIRFIMKEIGNGIKEIHDLGYAHRDIKPENVLIFQIEDNNGNTQDLYKICDFGTIKNVDVLQTQAIGTAYYLAPEQVNGSNVYSKKVDIWAFGALIYELLTGQPMFDGQTEYQVQNKIKNITQKQIDEKIQNNLKLERKYSTLLLNMLQIDIQKRHDINQVISDLRGTSQVANKLVYGEKEKDINRKPVAVNNYFDNKLTGIPNPIGLQQPINQQNQQKIFNNLPKPNEIKFQVQQQPNESSQARGRNTDQEEKTQKFQYHSPQNPPTYNPIRSTMNPMLLKKTEAPTQTMQQSQDTGKSQPINQLPKPVYFLNQADANGSQNRENGNLLKSNFQNQKNFKQFEQQEQNKNVIQQQQQQEKVQNQQITRASINPQIGQIPQNTIQKQISSQPFNQQEKNQNVIQQQQQQQEKISVQQFTKASNNNPQIGQFPQNTIPKQISSQPNNYQNAIQQQQSNQVPGMAQQNTQNYYQQDNSQKQSNSQQQQQVAYKQQPQNGNRATQFNSFQQIQSGNPDFQQNQKKKQAFFNSFTQNNNQATQLRPASGQLNYVAAQQFGNNQFQQRQMNQGQNLHANPQYQLNGQNK